MRKVKKIKRKIKQILFNYRVYNNKLFTLSDLIMSKDLIAKDFPKLEQFYSKEDIKTKLTKQKYKFKSAAVIFNSGLLLQKELGKEIDRNDIVIRVNFLPTKGFEKYVGSKTTIRVMGRDWLFKEYENEILVRTYNDQRYYINDIENLERSEKLRNTSLYICNNNINDIFYPYLNGMMTNGFRSVLLGLSLCKKVTIYGAEMSNLKHQEGNITTHFPTNKELPYIKDCMRDYNVSQDFDWYFEPIIDSNNTATMHGTINNEYKFYIKNPRVKFYK